MKDLKPYFKDRLFKVFPDYKVIGDFYKDVKGGNRIKIQCNYGVCSVNGKDVLKGHPLSILTADDKSSFWINMCKEKHNNKYSYNNVSEYKTARDMVAITCPIHGDFIQKRSEHLVGCGCMLCANINKGKRGWTKTEYIKCANGREAELYFIRCWNAEEEFYKIGMTVVGVDKRFKDNNMPYNFEVIKTIKGDAGYIYDLENLTHKYHKDFKYNPKIDFKGHTECFSKLIIK